MRPMILIVLKNTPRKAVAEILKSNNAVLVEREEKKQACKHNHALNNDLRSIRFFQEFVNPK